MGIHFLIYLAYKMKTEKEGIAQFPLSEKEGIGQFPLFHERADFLGKSYDLVRTLVFHFSLYYNVNGMGIARRYWRIPSSSFGEKKFEFPTRGFAAHGEFIFFHRGIRREFSNTSSPSSSHYLIYP